MNIAKLLTIAGSMVVVGATAGTATAEILAYKSNTNADTFSNSDQLIRITEADATEFAFSNPVAGLVAVTFSAECAVANSGAGQWLKVSILINGIAVKPTTDDAAFCTDNGTGQYQWATQSITVAKRLPKGSHIVKIQASHYSSSGTGWLDDKAVLVAR